MHFDLIRTGNEMTPSSKYDFKFKDYAPWVFRRIRNVFRVDPAEYLVTTLRLMSKSWFQLTILF